MSRCSSPSTARWAVRTRRSLNASTSAKISATTATPAAASATIPCVVVSSSIEAQRIRRRGGRRSSGEDRCKRRLVVVQVLLAGHPADLHRDGDRAAGGRRRGQRDAHGLGLAGGDRRELLLDDDRLAGA